MTLLADLARGFVLPAAPEPSTVAACALRSGDLPGVTAPPLTPGAFSVGPAATGTGVRLGGRQANPPFLPQAEEHSGANSAAQSERRLDLLADAQLEPDPWSAEA